MRTHGHRVPPSTAATRAVLLGVLLLMGAGPACAAEPTVADLLRLTRELDNAGKVRVSTAGQVVTLARPRVEPDGMTFGEVAPPVRTSLFRSAKAFDPAPANPIAWEQIERVDVEVSHRTRSVIIGALAGWLVGSVIGMATAPQYSGEFPQPSGKAVLIGIGAGATFGALVSVPSWRQVYPASEER
jgi:hypothetical protein